MIRSIKKVIKIFDVFATPITFNFDGKEKYSSVCGGLSTLTLIVLILLAFQNQIKVFANREIMYYDTTSELYANPKELRLTPKNELFAVKIEQNVGSAYSQKPYFVVNVQQNNYTTENGKKTESTSLIRLLPCIRERFTAISEEMGKSFDEFGLDEFLCPDEDAILYLKGTYLSPEFNFIRFSVDNCNNGYSDTVSWNVTCADQNEIDEYFTEEGQFKLMIYTVNYVVNPSQLDNYYQMYLSDDLTFSFQPQLKQLINIYFKEYCLNTDYSLIPGAEIVTDKVIYREEGNIRQETLYNIKDTPLVLYLRSGFMSTTTERSFQKIDQLLAYFGGMFNVAVLVFGIVIKQINEMLFKIEMANKVYSFIGKKEIRTQFYANKNNYLRKLQQFNNKDQNAGFRTQLKNLYIYFKETILKEKKIYAGFGYFVYLFSCKKKLINQNNLLIDKSLQQILGDMNVRLLMKKLQDTEKLKTVLFSDNQQQLFNFTPRLIIQAQMKQQKNTLINEEVLPKRTKGEHQFKKFIQAYGEVSANKQSGLEGFITSKLLQSLGVEVIKILQQGVSFQDEPLTSKLEDPPIFNDDDLEGNV